MKRKLLRVLRLPLAGRWAASETTGLSQSSPEPLRPRVEFAAGRNRHRSRAGEFPMKRLMLLPALALALAACSEVPTAPLPTPGGPQWDLLSHPDSDLAFVDEGASTNCRRVTPTEVACIFEITGAAYPDEIKVSTYVEFVWRYECLAKNPRNNTHGSVTQTSLQWGRYSMDPVRWRHTHTATQPTENPCPRSGNPTVRWSPHVQYWYVHAEYPYLRGWICKSSDGTCR